MSTAIIFFFTCAASYRCRIQLPRISLPKRCPENNFFWLENSFYVYPERGSVCSARHERLCKETVWFLATSLFLCSVPAVSQRRWWSLALLYLRLSAQKFGLSMFAFPGLCIQVHTLHVYSELLLPHGLLARFFTHLFCGEPQCPRQH